MTALMITVCKVKHSVNQLNICKMIAIDGLASYIYICNKARRVSHKGRGNELKYLWTFSCSQKYYIPSSTYTYKGKMADDLSFIIDYL